MKARAFSLILAASALFGQSKPVTFDVASIKPHQGGNERRAPPHFLPGGRFTSAGVPLRFLIAIAYNVGFQSVRLSGGPAWINTGDSVYDIDATAAPGAFPPGMPTSVREERERQMLQALLAERFGVVVRRETKEMTAYAVVVGRNGPKLQKAKIEEKDCPNADATPTAGGVACHAITGGRGRGIHGEAISLADVSEFVENWSDRPMVDKTGIGGLFNIQTRGWLPMQPGPPPAAGAKGEDGAELADMPTLFQIFEQLGLKLEAQKLPVDVYVIERVDKPTEN